MPGPRAFGPLLCVRLEKPVGSSTVHPSPPNHVFSPSRQHGCDQVGPSLALLAPRRCGLGIAPQRQLRTPAELQLQLRERYQRCWHHRVPGTCGLRQVLQPDLVVRWTPPAPLVTGGAAACSGAAALVGLGTLPPSVSETRGAAARSSAARQAALVEVGTLPPAAPSLQDHLVLFLHARADPLARHHQGHPQIQGGTHRTARVSWGEGLPAPASPAMVPWSPLLTMSLETRHAVSRLRCRPLIMLLMNTANTFLYFNGRVLQGERSGGGGAGRCAAPSSSRPRPA